VPDITQPSIIIIVGGVIISVGGIVIGLDPCLVDPTFCGFPPDPNDF